MQGVIVRTLIIAAGGAAVERLSPAVTTAWRQVVDRVGLSVQ